MQSAFPAHPPVFKGIALFTPGGDAIYSIDTNKQGNWHGNLCHALQRMLGLSSPPHFLIPGYTATVDRWFDPSLGTLRTEAEFYPAIRRYRPLLDAIFDLNGIPWQQAPWKEEFCNPSVIEAYRAQFPQLWENHDLIVRLDSASNGHSSDRDEWNPPDRLSEENFQGYVLRLFVSGDRSLTKGILQTIHEFLERELHHPYTLKVIDISKHPELAESHHISATPTLMRVQPQPVKRVVGDLADLPKVLQIIVKP